EFSGNIDFHREMHQPVYGIGNSQISRIGHQFFVCCAKIRFLRKTIGFQFTGMTVNDLLKMLIVPVDDSNPALGKQTLLALQVLFETAVLIGTDMILPDIGKDSEIKGNAAASMEHQRLGGN